jgi:hypothetical protein
MMLWRAIYSDNTELNQYENGQEQSWKKIDLDRIKFFDLMDGDKRVFRLHLFDGRRLIYRRRVVMNYNADGENVVYLVGWKKNNIQSIAYVHESDNTVLISGADGLEEPYSLPIGD